MSGALPSDCVLEVPPEVAERFHQAALAAADTRPLSSLHRDTNWRLFRDEFRVAVGRDAYDRLSSALRERTSRPPYFAVLRGLRSDSQGHLLLALSTGLGELVFPDRGSGSTAVDIIRPGTDFATEKWGVNNETLHTDSTMWRRPNQYTCLLTLEADQTGGSTRLLDIDRLSDLLAGSELAAFLCDVPLPWGMDEPGGGFLWRPIIVERTIRWARFSIGRSNDGAELTLDREIARALDAFTRFLAECADTWRIDTAPGELLVVDNTRTLHGRTKVADPRGSQRLLLRTRIGSSA